MHNERVLITGTTGMLGRHFLEVFREKYESVYTLNRSDGSLSDYEFVNEFVSKINPDIIIHCIADTNLSRCEDNKNDTLILHCGLTECLSSFKSKFIYISTDSVLDPVNFYAKTKYLGEKLSLINNKDSMVVRTNIYGFNSSSKNSLVEWALNNFIHSKTITGFSDVVFNAVYTKQLVESVYELIKYQITGTVNVAGNYSISKLDFLKELCKTFGYSSDLISDGKISDINKSIERPMDTTLDTEILNNLGICLNLETGLKKLKDDMEKL